MSVTHTANEDFCSAAGLQRAWLPFMDTFWTKSCGSPFDIGGITTFQGITWFFFSLEYSVTSLLEEKEVLTGRMGAREVLRSLNLEG